MPFFSIVIPSFEKRGICGIMDVTFYPRRIQTHLLTFLQSLPLGIAHDPLINLHPGFFPKGFNVFLKSRSTRILPHLQPGEGSKRLGVLQMKSQFLVRQISILLQYGTPQNLFRGHAGSAYLVLFKTDEILINSVKNLGSFIQNLRHHLQLFPDIILKRSMKNVHLSFSFLTHCPTLQVYSLNNINVMRLQCAKK